MQRATDNQGFDGPTLIAEESVYFKIEVQRVGLDFCESGLTAAYRARVFDFDPPCLNAHGHAFARRWLIVQHQSVVVLFNRRVALAGASHQTFQIGNFHVPMVVFDETRILERIGGE
jgi:hypothetical protein